MTIIQRFGRAVQPDRTCHCAGRARSKILVVNTCGPLVSSKQQLLRQRLIRVISLGPGYEISQTFQRTIYRIKRTGSCCMAGADMEKMAIRAGDVRIGRTF